MEGKASIGPLLDDYTVINILVFFGSLLIDLSWWKGWLRGYRNDLNLFSISHRFALISLGCKLKGQQ